MTAPGADQTEDARLWVGRVQPGREADHERFVAWLGSDEGREVLRRRRLTEYRLAERDGRLTVLFKARHTGDPRILIDVLRYPGLWPDFWVFEHGGRAADEAELDGTTRVAWRRAPAEEGD